jgi:hypothetical protein
LEGRDFTVGAVLPVHRSARAEIEQLRVVRSPDGSVKGLGFLFGCFSEQAFLKKHLVVLAQFTEQAL